jgi:hypothetical protein
MFWNVSVFQSFLTPPFWVSEGHISDRIEPNKGVNLRMVSLQASTFEDDLGKSPTPKMEFELQVDEGESKEESPLFRSVSMYTCHELCVSIFEKS